MILVDPRNPEAQEMGERLAADLPEGVDDLALVLGGDGWMLHCVREHGLDQTYLGLNAGRIGFLLNDVRAWDHVVDKLQRRAFQVYALPVLDVDWTGEDGAVHHTFAVNDVALERSTGQTAHLRLSIDGREVVETLVADGLVFATALGSTAYTFSAGGPACHPTLELLAVTAICAHHPRLSPFVLPAGASAVVEVQAAWRRPVRVVPDGQAFDQVVRAEVGLSGSRVRLAWLEGHDLTARMVTKILHP